MERYFAHASTSAGTSALPVSCSAGQPASSGELSSITTQQPGSSSAEQPDSTGRPASSAVEQRISTLLDVERWLASKCIPGAPRLMEEADDRVKDRNTSIESTNGLQFSVANK